MKGSHYFGACMLLPLQLLLPLPVLAALAFFAVSLVGFVPSLTGRHDSSDSVDVWMTGSEEKLDYMAAVKSQLETLAIPVFMVETFGAGDAFGGQTAVGLYNALALVAFCSDDYGTKTGAQYETFVELRYAHQNDIHIIPVQLHDTFPPQPRDEEGRAQNALVLRRDIIRIQDIGMHPSPCPGNFLRWSVELLAVVSTLSSFLSSKNLVLTTFEARSAKGRPGDCGRLECASTTVAPRLGMRSRGLRAARSGRYTEL